MRSPAVILLLAALVAFSARAQDTPPPAAEPEVRRGRERPSPRLLLVLDVSGSMRGLAISAAIQQAVELAFMPTDDIEVGVVIFTDTFQVIEGPDGPDSVWYRLPSAPNEERLRAAITTIGTSGKTAPGPAMHHAMLMGAQTVVLITDGIFGLDPVIDQMGAAYQELKRRGAPRPNLGIIGVGTKPLTPAFRTLETIAGLAGASFQTCDLPEAPPPLLPLPVPPQPEHRVPIGPPLPPNWPPAPPEITPY